MSFQVAPDSVQSAAQNLSNIHSTLEDASASVAAPTTGVAAAAEDEVSAGVAALFNSFGQEYQVLSAQAQGFHAQFVNLLNAGAGAYLSTEVANAEQALASQVTAPVQGLLGAATSTSGGAAAAFASSVSAVHPAAFPILGGLGGGTVGSLLGGLGGGTPGGSLFGGLGGGTVGSLLGGFGGGAPVGSLLGGLGGGSLVSSLNGVATALENGNAFSLLTAPIGTGLQTLSREIAALPTTLQSCGSALAPGLLHAGASTGSTGGPYQTLFEDTIANLQTLGTGISANPAPFLHQIITNATGYANTIAADFQYLIQNFPTVLANMPANIQAGLQGLLAFNPAPYIQQFIHNQITYANIIATSLQNAGHDFLIGLEALPAAFQSAWQQLMAGNIGGAFSDVTGGFLGLFVTGLDVTSTGNVLVAPGVNANVALTGTLADLNPIFSIPGMMAQNLTNLLPAGSIAAQISQNATNVINTLTDTSLTAQAFVTVTLRPLPLPPTLIVNATVDAYAGLPTALTIEALGGPLNALDATSASLTQFVGQLQTGDPIGAITTLADSPAYIANAFLNGQSTLPLSFDIDGYPAVVNLPLDGLLVPQTSYTASISGLPLIGSLTVPVGGTPISGLATGLLVYAPEQLASAIS
ncbi:MAG: PE family protein [Mycobacterium sp.]|nr:PE family protein [Mycobacterium sp.]HKI40834.1 PE family protein [Mycobacterium sp.]